MISYQAFTFQQINNPTERVVMNEPTALIPIGPKHFSKDDAKNYIESVIDFDVDYTILPIHTK